MVLALYQAFLHQGLPRSYAFSTRLPSALCAICDEHGPPCPDCTVHTPLLGDPTPGCTRAQSPSEGYNFEGGGGGRPHGRPLSMLVYRPVHFRFSSLKAGQQRVTGTSRVITRQGQEHAGGGR